jgi:hypothetical protein
MSAGVLQCGIGTLRKERMRVTTLLACSCQFTTCWGLPCRHILALLWFLKQQGDHTILLALIASQWRVDTESRAAATTLALVSGAAAAAAAQHTASPRLTSTDRLTGLMNLFRPIAELASRRVDWTTLVTNALQVPLCTMRISLSSEESAPTMHASDGAASAGVPLHLGIPLTPRARPQTGPTSGRGRGRGGGRGRGSV